MASATVFLDSVVQRDEVIVAVVLRSLVERTKSTSHLEILLLQFRLFSCLLKHLCSLILFNQHFKTNYVF